MIEKKTIIYKRGRRQCNCFLFSYGSKQKEDRNKHLICRVYLIDNWKFTSIWYGWKMRKLENLRSSKTLLGFFLYLRVFSSFFGCLFGIFLKWWNFCKVCMEFEGEENSANEKLFFKKKMFCISSFKKMMNYFECVFFEEWNSFN